jgi:hypothetical protein
MRRDAASVSVGAPAPLDRSGCRITGATEAVASEGIERATVPPPTPKERSYDEEYGYSCYRGDSLVVIVVARHDAFLLSDES